MRLPAWAAPALVGAVALLVGGVGIGARDLTGDEIAVVNDLYSLWLLAGAGLASMLLSRGTGGTLLWRWAPAVALGLPVAGVVLAQLSGEAMGLHADPAPLDLGPGALTLARLHRFAGAAVHGYAAGRGTAAWELGPAVVGLAGLLLANLRDPRARRVGAVWAGGLLAASAAGVGVWAMADRVLPVEPRSMIGLVPAFSIGSVLAIDRLPRAGRGLAAGLLLLLVGGSTLQQTLDRSTTHRDLAAWVAAGWAPGEVVVAEPRLQWRLRAAGLPAAALRPCLSEAPDAPALWWLRVQPLDPPLSDAGCPAGDGTTAPVSLDG